MSLSSISSVPHCHFSLEVLGIVPDLARGSSPWLGSQLYLQKVSQIHWKLPWQPGVPGTPWDSRAVLVEGRIFKVDQANYVFRALPVWAFVVLGIVRGVWWVGRPRGSSQLPFASVLYRISGWIGQGFTMEQERKRTAHYLLVLITMKAQ